KGPANGESKKAGASDGGGNGWLSRIVSLPKTGTGSGGRSGAIGGNGAGATSRTFGPVVEGGADCALREKAISNMKQGARQPASNLPFNMIDAFRLNSAKLLVSQIRPCRGL